MSDLNVCSIKNPKEGISFHICCDRLRLTCQTKYDRKTKTKKIKNVLMSIPVENSNDFDDDANAACLE